MSTLRFLTDAVQHATRRANREQKQMVIYHLDKDQYGRENVWFVRAHDDSPPLGAEIVLRCDYE